MISSNDFSKMAGLDMMVERIEISNAKRVTKVPFKAERKEEKEGEKGMD